MFKACEIENMVQIQHYPRCNLEIPVFKFSSGFVSHIYDLFLINKFKTEKYSFFNSL